MNTSSPAVIRAAILDDAAAILDIYKPYIESSHVTFEYTIPSLDEYRERMRSVMQTYPWLVSQVNGEIAGYAYATKFRERAAYQWDFETSIYIADKFQRDGLATDLYNALFEACRELGFYNAVAVMSLPNEKSHKFHLKMGFREVGIFRNTGFKQGKWYDVLFLEKNITPCTGEPAELRKPAAF
jgi:L-amino acid N-acyltransferase YncA